MFSPHFGNVPLLTMGASSATVGFDHENYIRQHFQREDRPDLTEKQKEELLSLMLKYKEVFCNKPGATKAYFHHVNTGNAEPINCKTHAWPQYKKELLHKEIKQLLKDGIIKTSTSEWSSPCLLLNTNDPRKKPRFVLDMRALNKIIKKDSFPMLSVEELLYTIHKPKYISSYDMSKGYFQISLRPEDSPKTAFLVPGLGKFEFTKLPMGEINSSFSFTRCMKQVLPLMNEHGLLVYLDDLFVGTDDWDQHLKSSEYLFSSVGAAGMTLHLEKSTLAKQEAKILGFLVNSEGIKIDPEKITAIKQIKRPTTVRHLRKFLGATGYFRRYIKDYAALAEPLNRLLKKNNTFIWGEEQHQSFETLKEKLSTAPILSTPSPGAELTLTCDASSSAIGSYLSQSSNGEESIIAYYSRSLSPAERKYSATHREALAAADSMDHFRMWLEGKHFTLQSDHASLSALAKTPDPFGTIGRLSLRLQEYDFSVKFKPGRENHLADFLSRSEEVPELPNLEPYQKTMDSSVQTDEIDFPNMLSSGNKSNISNVLLDTLKAQENPFHETTVLKTETAREPHAEEPINQTNDNYESADRTKRNTDVGSPPEREERATTIAGVPKPGIPGSDVKNKPVCLATTSLPEDDVNQTEMDSETLLETAVEREILIDMQRTDPNTAEIYSILENLLLPNSQVSRKNKKKVKNYSLSEKLLIFNNKGTNKIVIPVGFRQKVMNFGHTHKLCGHFGIKRTLERINRLYHWRCMSTDVKKFVRGCISCAQYKPDTGKPKGFLHSQIHETPWSHVFVDFIGPLVRSTKNNTYLLVFQDGLTRACELAAVRNATAQTVAKTLFQQIICRYGVPLQVYSDNAAVFRSELHKETCKLMDIEPCTVIAYKPSSNRVERCNQDLVRLIAIAARNKHTAWDNCIPEIQFSFNCAKNASTGQTPFFLNHFREARLPMLATEVFDSDKLNHVENLPGYVQHLAETVPKIFKETRENIEAATKKYAYYYNQNRRDISYTVGDYVFDQTHFQSSASQKFMKKLAPLYSGPFIISKKISDVSYEIADPSNMKTIGKRHITQLKRFHPNTELIQAVDNNGAITIGNTTNLPSNLAENSTAIPPTIPKETTHISHEQTGNYRQCSSTWCTYDEAYSADVQCSNCKSWFHNICAGVFNNHSVSFTCRNCA